MPMCISHTWALNENATKITPFTYSALVVSVVFMQEWFPFSLINEIPIWIVQKGSMGYNLILLIAECQSKIW